MKVHNNTLQQEPKKYARLCVELNLYKPQISMFTIKLRKYNVEYKDLHLLCVKCGNSGHYKEGFPNKIKKKTYSDIGKPTMN